MDQDLIRRANLGEEEAMRELYEGNRVFAYNLAMKYLADVHEAQDVLQEVFAYFFAKFPGFVLTCELRTFLFPVIRNKCLSRLRKKRPETNPEILENQEDHTLRNEQSERQRVLDMVADLAPQHRQVLILRFVDQLSLDEIGASLAIPTGTVKSRLFNGLRKLRENPDFLWLLSFLKFSDFQ